jgi:hypothetical protein
MSLGSKSPRLARDFRAIQDVELALHEWVIGDTVAPFMAPPDTDPAYVRQTYASIRQRGGGARVGRFRTPAADHCCAKKSTPAWQNYGSTPAKLLVR